MFKSTALPVMIGKCLPFLAVLLTGLGAGVVNGLLGTGGGILLLLILKRSLAPRDAFAASLVCILPLSVLSLLLYLCHGTVTASALLTEDTVFCLLGALPGGLLGAYLLDRIKPSCAELLFAALLVFSGWRMAFA